MLLNSIKHVYMYNPGYKKGSSLVHAWSFSVQVV